MAAHEPRLWETLQESGYLDFTAHALKPGFHMIAPIARVAPIARNSMQTIQAILWKQSRKVEGRPGRS